MHEDLFRNNINEYTSKSIDISQYKGLLVGYADDSVLQKLILIAYLSFAPKSNSLMPSNVFDISAMNPNDIALELRSLVFPHLESLAIAIQKEESL